MDTTASSMPSTEADDKDLIHTPSTSSLVEKDSENNEPSSNTDLETLSSEPDENEADEPEDPDPQDAQSDSYRSSISKILFIPLVKLIVSHIESSCDPSTSFTTRAAHNAHYRGVWKDLIAKAMADASIPNSLFDPPRSFVEVKIAQWPRPNSEHYCCPCDLEDDSLSGIEIRTSRVDEGGQGITKEVFLRQLGEAFYGLLEESDEIAKGKAKDGQIQNKKERDYVVGDEDDRPVINDIDAMRASKGLIGHMYAMTRGYEE